MKLDNRLKTIANFVEKSKKVLDVGTDHGYLCLYLVKNKKVEKGIASDISQPSLQKAVDLIKKEKMEDKIECRLGSGLKVINEKDKVDTIVIAGMGGILISEILDEDKELIVKTKPKFILQPVQRPEILREYLVENMYNIEDETLVEADGKIYNIIVARYVGEKIYYDKKFFEIGKGLVNDAYKKQIDFLIKKNEAIIMEMEKSVNGNLDEKSEKQAYVKFLKELKLNEISENKESSR